MANIRVDQIAQPTESARSESAEFARRRLMLFGSSRFENERSTFAGIGRPDLSALKSSTDDNKDSEAPAAVDAVEEAITFRAPDGAEVTLPRMSAEDKAKVSAIYADMSPEHQALVEKFALAVGGAALIEAQTNPNAPDAPFSDRLKSSASSFSEQVVITQGESDHEDAVTDQVLLGMQGIEQNLRDYFDGVREQQLIAGEVRTDVAEIRSVLATWPDDGSTEVFDYREVEFNEDGSITVVEHRDVELTKAEAQALATKLDGDIASLGQFEQREMFMLQKMVNDYQKAETTLSNVMKTQHDTHKALIQNARA